MKINLKIVIAFQAVVIAILIGYFAGKSSTPVDSANQITQPTNTSSPDPTPSPALTDSHGWPTSLEGRWDNSDLQEGYPGFFVVIKRTEGDFYNAKFFDMGQNGAIALDETATIEDVGGGVLEVTWSDGTTNEASWGIRDANTTSDVIDSWVGDIWFECSEHLPFQPSRAQCDFLWSGVE